MRRQSIEGVVLERFDDYISATLIESGGWQYYAEFDIDRFEHDDQPLLEPGVLFTISAGSELKVRRKVCRCNGENCQCRKVAS